MAQLSDAQRAFVQDNPFVGTVTTLRADGSPHSTEDVGAELTEEGADAHIDALAKTYLGVDSYPFRRAGEQRVMVRIRIDKVDGIGF